MRFSSFPLWLWGVVGVVGVLSLVPVQGEYNWNGSDWVWQDSQSQPGSPDREVGSGVADDTVPAIEDVSPEEESSGQGADISQVPDLSDDYDATRNAWIPEQTGTELSGANGDIFVAPSDPTPGTPPDADSNLDLNHNRINSTPSDPKQTSFFAQPGTLAAVVGGAVVGLLCAILCVMFVVYRMRKKDEGSYALDEPKRSTAVTTYGKTPSREFYA